MDNSNVTDGVNQAPIDRFTLGHFAVGIGLAAAGASPSTALVMAIGWELIEGPLKVRTPAVFPNPSPDSPANASLDAAAMMLGWYLAAEVLR